MSQPITLFEAFERHLDAHPDDLLYRFLHDGRPTGPSTAWSYAETYARCVGVAERLREHGLAGKRALLLYPPSLDYVATFLGCLMARTIAVPAYPPDPSRLAQTLPRLLAIAEAAEIDVILTTSKISAFARALVGNTPIAQVDWLNTDGLEGNPGDRTWLGPPERSDLAYLQYTSGSTSTPKGVMVTHANITHNSVVIRDKFGSSPSSVGVIWLPPYHDMGLVGGIMQPLYVGFPTVLMSPIDFLKHPMRWLEAVSHFRGTISGGPDFAYALCTRRFQPEEHQLELSSWVLAFNGAEPIQASTLDRFTARFAPHGFTRRAFYPCYGLAEATLMITGGDRERVAPHRLVDKAALASGRFVPGVDEDEAFELVSSGAAADGHEIVIVDPQVGQRVEPGTVGEIWVAGPSVTAGYWNQPEATRASFEAVLLDQPDAGQYLRTGDLGFVADGELYVTGRIKDLIIVRGRNHYPQDLEASATNADPSIRGGCVAAFSSEVGHEPGVGIVAEIKDGSQERLDAIVGAIRAAIASEHSVGVSEVALLRPRAIPKTSSGKLIRSACQAGVRDGSLAPLCHWRIGDRVEPHPETAEAAKVSEAAEAAKVSEAAEAKAPAAPSPEMPEQPSRWSARRLGAWLRAALSRELGIPEDRVDGQRPLVEYGLDSAVGVQLAGELESLLGRPVPATLVWDYPTLDAISAHLGDPGPDHAAEAVPPAPSIRPAAARDDAIAIVAVGCRFPGGVEGPEELWRLLIDGVDPISSIPPMRWDAGQQLEPGPPSPARGFGGFIEGVERFDASFFHISPREAEALDPQQRLLLEVSWEALDGAGLTTRRLAGSSTGVFVGISSNDYFRRQDRAGRIDPHYSVTGNLNSVAAGRIAYCLGLTGPAMAIDTACSSSLVAVHLACQSLRNGDCDRALAGGVSLMLSPEGNLYFDRLHALSPTGRCATFDDGADGYVRSEGCAMLVLERLSDAQRAGRPILGVVRGVAVSHDGRTNGLTAPSGPSQEAVIRRALARAEVDPAMVDYVEAHGTGTPLGDPIELQSLGAVYGSHRPPDAPPLRVGSIKSNLGHTEAAAGVAGVIKVLLAMQAEQLPPNLHFRRPNERVRLMERALQVVDRATPWPRHPDRPRLAGVSSFGFSGTNVHLVLEEPPPSVPPARRARPETPQLVVLAAHGRPALAARLGRLRDWLDGPSARDHELDDVAFSLASSGSHLPERIAVVASSPSSLRERLGSHEGSSRPAGVRGRLAFLFSGQGAVRPGMGRRLAQRWPVCAEVLVRCARIFERSSGQGAGLREVMEATEGEPAAALLMQTEYAQPAIFTFQAMLLALWRSLGVEPDFVLGHSVGELAAAHGAGILDLEDAMALVVARGRGMASTPSGAMASLGMSEAEARALLRDREGLTIAAINGPRQVVVSGDPQKLDELERELSGSRTAHRRLPVDRAFHSPSMEPMLDQLAAHTRSVRHRAPQRAFVSTVTGAPLAEPGIDADYWLEHVRAPVRFLPAVEAIGSHVDVFIEIGPLPVLSPLARACLPGREARFLPCGRHGSPEDATVLEALAVLYERGFDVELDALFGDDHRRVALPRYPWQHERYWIDPPAPRPLVATDSPIPSSSVHALVERQLELLDQQLGLLGARRKPSPSTEI